MLTSAVALWQRVLAASSRETCNSCRTKAPMKRRASDERSRPVSRQQRRHRRGTGRLSCFLAVLACGLVCYLVSVLHLFRAHAPPPRYPVGARTAAKMLSHAYDDDGKPKPKPSIIRPPQPKQPQPPKDACAAHRWRQMMRPRHPLVLPLARLCTSQLRAFGWVKMSWKRRDPPGVVLGTFRKVDTTELAATIIISSLNTAHHILTAGDGLPQ